MVLMFCVDLQIIISLTHQKKTTLGKKERTRQAGGRGVIEACNRPAPMGRKQHSLFDFSLSQELDVCRNDLGKNDRRIPVKQTGSRGAGTTITPKPAAPVT